MNAYEITFIVRPDLDEELTRSASRQVLTRLEGVGAEVIASHPWNPARRRMAYPIKDFGDGYYFTATFNIDPTALQDFESTLRLNNDVVRFLIVQASELQIRQSQQRMQQATAPPPAPVPVQTPPTPQPAATTQPAAPALEVPAEAEALDAEPVANSGPAPAEGDARPFNSSATLVEPAATPSGAVDESETVALADAPDAVAAEPVAKTQE